MLASVIKKSALQYPVVTLIGPRQAGKTSLAKNLFPEKDYVNLEPLDTRAAAKADPRKFLRLLPDGGVIDEVQRLCKMCRAHHRNGSWREHCCGFLNRRIRYVHFIPLSS